MRTVIAFIAAPLLPAMLPSWFLHTNYPDRAAVSGFIFICGILYLLQALVGIPAYALARVKRRYIWFYLLLGLVAMPGVHVAIIIIFSKTKISIAETFLEIAYFGALGAAIGVLFWLIARPDRVADADISN